jgi:hypothetical protein
MKWIKISDKLPKHGEKIIATDGETWDVAFFYKGNIDACWFDTIDLDSQSIKAWARVTPYGKE